MKGREKLGFRCEDFRAPTDAECKLRRRNHRSSATHRVRLGIEVHCHRDPNAIPDRKRPPRNALARCRGTGIALGMAGDDGATRAIRDREERNHPRVATLTLMIDGDSAWPRTPIVPGLRAAWPAHSRQWLSVQQPPSWWRIIWQTDCQPPFARGLSACPKQKRPRRPPRRSRSQKAQTANRLRTRRKPA